MCELSCERYGLVRITGTPVIIVRDIDTVGGLWLRHSKDCWRRFWALGVWFVERSDWNRTKSQRQSRTILSLIVAHIGQYGRTKALVE
jgi:hypothetical protein